MDSNSGVLIMGQSQSFSQLMAEKLLEDGISVEKIFTSVRGISFLPSFNQNPNLPSSASITKFAEKVGFTHVIFNPHERFLLPIVDHLQNSSLTVTGLGSEAHHYLTCNKLIETALETAHIAHPASFTCCDRRNARARKEAWQLPLVLKNKKIEAGGKWGFVCLDEKEFKEAVTALIPHEVLKLKEAKPKETIIQKYIQGEYASLVILCYHTQFKIISGCDENNEEVKEKVIKPLLEVYKALRCNLSGFLKIRIVTTQKEIVVIDVNPFFTIEEMRHVLNHMNTPLLSLVPQNEVISPIEISSCMQVV